MAATMWLVWAVWAAAVVMVTWMPTVKATILRGPNVCNGLETYTSFVDVSYTKAYQVRTHTFCLSIPPRCTRYKIAYRTAMKRQSRTETRSASVCCSGYTRVPAEDRCVPLCSQDCVHGTCVRPDQCHCEDGYSGPSCNTRELTPMPTVEATTLRGANVCNEQETYTSFVNMSYSQAYQVRTHTFCLSIPPKCTKFKIAYRTAFKRQSRTETRSVSVCCSGYTRVPAGDRCVPLCSQECVHGTCVRPDQCHCEDGYSGPSCNTGELTPMPTVEATTLRGANVVVSGTDCPTNDTLHTDNFVVPSGVKPKILYNVWRKAVQTVRQLGAQGR